LYERTHMKIGISLFQFFQGEVGGAGEYIEQLIRHLPEYMSKNDQLFLFGNSKNLKPFDILKNDDRIRSVRFLISPLGIKIIRLLDLTLPNLVSRYISRKINKCNLDIVLFPQQSIFPHGIIAKKVVTIVDVVHLYFPELFSSFQRWVRFRKEKYVVINCDHIIAISDFSRKDLIKNFNFPEENSTSIYLGINLEKISIRAEEVKTPYIFYPANAYPHKNHDRLIEAFEKFKSTFPEINGNLILSGNPTPSLLRRIAKSDASEFICHEGFVSRADLLELYQGCKALFFPSLFEGFGIPIIEAMKHKKPVFCSDLSVFRELIGNVATYFNPNSIEEMVQNFKIIFENMAPRPVNLEEYQLILKKLNWGECAKNTIMLLKKVVNSGERTQ
jgi:glycosyltransferase involved in cell wall biosynthesis